MFKEKLRHKLKKRGVSYIGSSLILKDWKVVCSLKRSPDERKKETSATM